MAEQQKQKEPGSWEKWEAIFRRQRGSCCASSHQKPSLADTVKSQPPGADQAVEPEFGDRQ